VETSIAALQAAIAAKDAQIERLRAEVERMKAAALAKDPASGQYREYDELVAERDRLRDAIQWVINDMNYNAPEQVNAELAVTWWSRLSVALPIPMPVSSDDSSLEDLIGKEDGA
jgi:cell division protein FtsB